MASKRGFTLIELLVVIAIIAILAAILFPVFAQAREKARAITCVSNEKQMGLAMMQYTQDYDESFPMVQYYTPLGTPVDWYNAIQPYVKNGDSTPGATGDGSVYYGKGGIWACPDFPSPEASEYGVNWELCGDGIGTYDANTVGSSYTVPTAKLSDLQTPADTLMVGEHGKPANVAGQNYDYMTSYIQPSEGTWTAAIGPYSNGQPTKAESHNDLVFDKDCGATDTTPSCGAGWGDSPGDMPRYRHTNSTNVLFSDGHVKSKVKGQLSWFKNVYVQGLYEREASANGGITGWTYPIN